MAISNVASNLRPGVVTSTTRPTSPYEGQMIYCTDIDTLEIWNGSAWRTLAFGTATSGSVLQVAQSVVNTSSSTTSGSLVDISGLSVSITPRSTTSKIYVSAVVNIGPDGTNSDDIGLRLMRDGTAIGVGSGANTANLSVFTRGNDRGSGTAQLAILPLTMQHLDSPSTTSALTYKVQWYTRVGTIYLNRRASDTNFVTSSSITVMEIAG